MVKLCESEDIYWQDYQRRSYLQVMDELKEWGVEEYAPEYQGVWGAFRRLISLIGRKIPRISIIVKVTWGRSPGIFTLHFDPETRWFVEARERVGAVPIYRAVGDDIARAIIKDELTLEQEQFLLTPDEYLGE